MVMAAGQNGFAEGKIRGNVDMTLVGENALSMLPVQEVGVESWRDRAVHRLKCLQNKGVGGRGGLDAIGKGHINEVDKK